MPIYIYLLKNKLRFALYLKFGSAMITIYLYNLRYEEKNLNK